MTGPAPKTVVDDKSLSATLKAADKETAVHEQEVKDGAVVLTGEHKPEVGVTVEFEGAPGVEIRVRPEDLPEDARPKTSTDTGPIPVRREPSVKVVAGPDKADVKPTSRATGK